MPQRTSPGRKTNEASCVWEVSVMTPSRDQADAILRDVFSRCGIDQRDLVVTQRARTVEVSTYRPGGTEAARLSRKLHRSEMKGVRIRCRKIARIQWLKRFVDGIRPFPFAKSFVVIPAQAPSGTLPPGRAPVMLSIDLAFGTGLHETTRFMAALIERCRGRFTTFLDVGTGTGLLSIIAFRCGARMVWACDRDPVCSREAKRNLKMNRLSFSRYVTADFGTWKTKRSFDFVAANLQTDDLLRLRRKLAARVRPGGYLAVSGMALENLARFRDAYRSLPLVCRRILRGDKWAAALYQRHSAKIPRRKT